MLDKQKKDKVLGMVEKYTKLDSYVIDDIEVKSFIIGYAFGHQDAKKAKEFANQQLLQN